MPCNAFQVLFQERLGLDDAGNGGFGGSGSQGGQGGGGSGGHGGLSVGILRSNSAGLDAQANTFELGIPGTGGTGGSPQGQAGSAGVSSTDLSL